MKVHFLSLTIMFSYIFFSLGSSSVSVKITPVSPDEFPSPTPTITPNTYFNASHQSSQTPTPKFFEDGDECYFHPSPSSIPRSNSEAYLSSISARLQPEVSKERSKSECDLSNYRERVDPAIALARGPGSIEYSAWQARLEKQKRNCNSTDVLSDDEEDERNGVFEHEWKKNNYKRSGEPKPSRDSSTHNGRKLKPEFEEYVFGGNKPRRDAFSFSDPRHKKLMLERTAALDKAMAEADESARKANPQMFSLRLPRSRTDSGLSTFSSSQASTISETSSMARIPTRSITRTSLSSLFGPSPIESDETETSNNSDAFSEYDYYADSNDESDRPNIFSRFSSITSLRNPRRKYTRNDSDSSFIVRSVRREVPRQIPSRTFSLPSFRSLPPAMSTASIYGEELIRAGNEEEETIPHLPPTTMEEFQQMWIRFELGCVIKSHRLKRRIKAFSWKATQRNL